MKERVIGINIDMKHLVLEGLVFMLPVSKKLKLNNIS